MLTLSARRRYKQIQYVASLVRSACVPSPYVYQYILARAQDETARQQQQQQQQPPRVQDASVTVLPAIPVPASIPCATPPARISSLLPRSKRKPEACHSRLPGWCKRRRVVAGCAKPLEAVGPGAQQICPRSERVPLCIACINWVRRLSQHQQQKQAGAVGQKLPCSKGKYIPLDNLLLFAHDPGAFPEPDKRCMQRLLQNLCIEYCGESPQVAARNPYRCFETPIISRQVFSHGPSQYFLMNGPGLPKTAKVLLIAYSTLL